MKLRLAPALLFCILTVLLARPALAVAPQVAAGNFHTIALKSDGTVMAWGSNTDGQITVPAGLSGVIGIAAGGYHNIALKSDGSVVAWGYNGYGQIDVPTGLSGVIGIAAGYYHTVALKSDGEVTAWGSNEYSQTAVPVGLSSVIGIAAGGWHTAALKGDGTVTAWGYNWSGQTDAPAGLSGVIKIAAGWEHTVALKSDGTVVAWGNNNWGQTTVPEGLSGVVGIAARGYHTVALKSDGTVVAWGRYDFGQTTVPDGLSGVIGIAAGENHTVAVTSNGSVVAWGSNDYGRATPPSPSSLNDAVDVPLLMLSLTTGGDANWLSNNSEMHDGVDAAQSGDIGDLQETWMETTVNGAGTLSFWWKVSSEWDFDFLRFYIDGVEQSGSIEGSQDWAQKTYTIIESGTHTFRWAYNKDLSNSEHSDAGWVDQVVWTPTYTITPSASAGGSISPNTAQTVNLGGAASFTITPTTGYSISDVLVDLVSVGAVTSYTFSNVAANHTISATFSAIDNTAPVGNAWWTFGRTGQTTCYSDVGTVIACANTGQDGEIQMGAPWPDPRFIDNDDQSITDNLTGLIWQQDGSTPTFGECTGGTKTWQDALDYVACLNTNNYLGHNDWRLPNRLELESLVHRGQSNSASWLNAQGFTNTQSSIYWSSTTYSNVTVYAWLVHFYTGDTSGNVKTTEYYVRCVRSGQDWLFENSVISLPKTGQTTSYATGDDGHLQKGAAWPDPRFTDNGDQTATDNLTGLIWQKDGSTPTVGVCNGGTKTWQGALDYVACLNTSNYLGHNDWRLPNGLELASLLNLDRSNPATWLNTQGLINTQDSSQYWSSSTSADNTGNAWYVYFYDGSTGYGNKTTGGAGAGYIRCVRGGQTGSFGNLGIWINSNDLTTNSQTVTLTLSSYDTNGVSQMQFSNDSSSWSTPEAYATSKSWTLTAGDGTKTVYVKFKDNAGNWSEVYSDSIIYDTSPVAIITHPVDPANGTTAGFSFSSGTAASYQCQLDNGGYSSCTSPVTYTGLGEGTHTFDLIGTDAGGDDSSPVSYSWTIDTTPPVVSAGPNQLVSSQFNQTATATDANSMTYAWTKASGPGIVSFGTPTALSTTVSADTNGTYILRFTATDAAGNPAFNSMILVWNTVTPAVAAGENYTVALKSDGTIAAWGNNGSGQLNVPTGLSGTMGITAGWYHTVALKSDGTVVAWGDNNNGQTNVPDGLSGVVGIAAGYAHTVALKSDGTVVAWGYNGYGQTTVPTGLTGVIGIAAGSFHTLALKSDGTIVAWGYNDWGQATVPAGLSGATGIAAGYGHSVALKNDGTIVAWGYNNYGQIDVPTGLSGVMGIAAGDYHTVTLKNDGTIVAWGYNDYSQTTAPAGLSGVMGIAAGGLHSVALKSDGTVVAWGFTGNGQTTLPAPSTPIVTDDGIYAASANELHASWTATDANASINENQYSIGTYQGGTDLVDWTSTGATNEITATGLSLINGQTYYFTIKARNSLGGWSAEGYSDGITVNARTVTPSVSGNGSISPTAAQTVIVGQTTAYTLTSDADYHIASVTGCGGTLSGNTFTTGSVTVDCTVTVNFASNTSLLTVTKSGAGAGAVTEDIGTLGWSGNTATASYSYTTAVTLTATPDSGSFFKGWVGGGCSGVDSCTVSMNTDVTVYAVFGTIGESGTSKYLPISSNTTWTLAGSPYTVTQNILVNSGKTLTIEPGVTVKFNSGMTMQVNGALVARGASNAKIRFTSNQASPSAGNWGYILFTDSSTDALFDAYGNYLGGSILEHAVVEYAGGTAVPYNGAVRMNNAHPFINHSTIRNNSATGIYGYNLTGTLKITNSSISNNTASGDGGGIYLSGGTITIAGNTINNNTASSGGGGVYLYNSTNTVTENIITDNSSGGYWYGGGGGIGAIYGSSSISGNTIRGNTTTSHGGGISTSWDTSVISSNIIADNTTAGYGGGIYGYSVNSGSVTDNVIVGNMANDSGGGMSTNAAISRNIVSDNMALNRAGGIDSTGGPVSGNAIIRNSSLDRAAFDNNGTSGNNLQYNLISWNTATGAAPTRTINVSGTPLINFNNIFGNIASYALYNENAEGVADLDATNNWWATANEEEVLTKIYDWYDYAAQGLVVHAPFAEQIRVDAPMSPPTGLVAAMQGTDSINVTWNANSEADLAGYIVHWGSTPGFPYANSEDVGNATSHTITGLTEGAYYVTVTTYDADAAAVSDDPATIVNEKQTAGNESWYATEKTVYVDLSGPTGSVVINGEALFSHETFDNGTSGWKLSGSEYAVVTDYGSYGNALGGYGQTAGVELSKTYDLSSYTHTKIRIVAEYLTLDTWDGEEAFLKVDGSKVFSQYNYYGEHPDYVSNTNGYQDGRITIDQTIDHTGAELNLVFGSTLNQDPWDESFALADVKVYVYSTGGAPYTNTTGVTLNLSCADPLSGCSEMKFSNDNSTWSTPVSYANSTTWTVTSDEGTKTVYAMFKDETGNWSNAYSDTIELITGYALTATKSGTCTGSVTVNAGTLAWTGNSGSTVYDYNSTITLTAVPGTGCTFMGWSGCDSATGDLCTVSITSAKAVTATFDDTTAPVVSAGANQTVTGTGDVTLTATASDISGLTYVWSKASGPGNVTFGSPNSLSTTVSADANGTYILRLTATDAANNSAFNSMILVWNTITPSVAAGDYHTVALKSDGTVVAWGYNSYGQTTMPTGLSGVIEIAAGYSHTVALKSDGTVTAWGGIGYDYHQTSVPAGLSDVIEIAAGDTHTVALKGDGTVVAWGGYGYDLGQTSVPEGLSGVIGIAAGAYHTVALKSDGTVTAWGFNSNDQTTIPDGLSGVIGIAAGAYHTVALKSDGTVAAWGRNYEGQTNVPEGLSGVIGIAARGNHAVALKGDGTVVAWGYDGYGLAEVPVGLSGVIGIAAGYYHTVALKSDGTIVAWGSNDNGQCTIPAPTMSAVTDDGAYTATTGQLHTSWTATDSNASIVEYQYAIGSGWGGTDVVNWTSTGSANEVTATGLALNNGWTYYFMVKARNSLGGWSTEGYSDGITVDTSLSAIEVTPIVMSTGGGIDPASVQTVSVGNTVSFTITPETGYHITSVSGCGGALSGNTFTTGAINSPCTVTANFAIDTFTIEATAGAGGSISPSGTVTTNYGSNAELTITPASGYSIVDVLVDGSTIGAAASYVFTSVTASHTISATFADITPPVVSAGPNQTETSVFLQTATASDANTMTYQWTKASGPGTVIFGTPNSLATTISADTDGTYILRFTATDSAGNSAFNSMILVWNKVTPAVAAGKYHTMALKSDGTVAAWGDNSAEQLNVPPSLSGVVGISARAINSAALKSDGTVVSWGTNTYGVTDVPAALSGVIEIAAGINHTAALKGDGTVEAWGDNSNGQAEVPAGLKDIVGIAAGGYHTVALKSDGTVVAWGGTGYDYGQTSVPEGLTDVIGIAAGRSHTVALKSDGTVVAWGDNNNGQTAVPEGLSGVFGIAAGVFHSAALKSDGTVTAWGWNEDHQNDVPAGLTDVIGIAAGYAHTVALKSDGTIVVWGDDSYGQSSIPSPSTPVVTDDGAYTLLTSELHAEWTAADSVAPITEYQYAIGTSPGATDAVAWTSAGSANEITSSGLMLANGQTYYFSVKAKNSLGGWSAEGYSDGMTVDTSLTAATVTPSAGSGGSIDPSTAQSVVIGNTEQFTVTPAAGYHIESVVASCGGELSGNVFTTGAILGDCTVSATFASDTFTITASAGSGGSISPPGLLTAYYGSNALFTMTPDAGYSISDVLVDGVSVGAVSTYTFENVIGNHTISASFVMDRLSCSDPGIPCLQRGDDGDDSNNLVSGMPKYHVWRFFINIKDPAGYTPQYVRLYLASKTTPSAGDFYAHDLGCSGDYQAGATCEYKEALGPAFAYSFYFEARMNDGSIHRYPQGGEISGPQVRLLNGSTMIGIPRDLRGESLDGVSAFGPGSVYRWVSTGLTTSSNNGTYELVDTSVTPVVPGEGYIIKNPSNLTLQELSSYSDITDSTYEIRLRHGWNMLSSPYGSGVQLSNVQVRKGSTGTPIPWLEAAENHWLYNAIYRYVGSDWGSTYTYRSAGSTQRAVLDPWLGYWVYLNKDDAEYALIIQKP